MNTKELGIITNEQAAISGLFNDAIDKTKQALSSVTMEISSLLLPAFIKLIDYVKDTIVPSISNIIDKWNSMSDGQQKVILTMVGIATSIGPVLSVVGKLGTVFNTLSLSLHGTGISGIFAGQGLNAATLGIGALVALLAIALLSSEDFKNMLMELATSLMTLVKPLMGIVNILIGALKPIFSVIIELVVMLINLLMPLLDLILVPIQLILKVIGDLLTPLLPLIEMLANLLNTILVPVLELLLIIVKPIFDMISGIIGVISNAGNWLLGLTGAKNNATNSSVVNNETRTINNQVTVNTTSPTFDVNSINEALGGDLY